MSGIGSHVGLLAMRETHIRKAVIILLVMDDQHHLERAVRYLIRAGYDNIAGYLKGGVEGWYNVGYPIESLPILSVH